MESYLIYLGFAIATILLPGPAVMLTISNALQRGLSKSLAGVVGIALAILLVAFLSATGLGIVLATSTFAFNTIKIVGALYLIYLGIKMIRKKSTNDPARIKPEATHLKCFIEGFLVSASNPKAVIFFMSVFPQFIDQSKEFTPQFLLLAITFSALVVLIHTLYALFSSFAKTKLTSERSGVLLNKISGTVFVSFGVGLAASSR